MVEAVIFDVDGVLVDSELVQSQAFAAVMREHDIEPGMTEHGTIHIPGETSHRTFETLKQKHGIDADTHALVAKKREAVMRVLETGIEPMAGVLRLLNDLEEHQVPMAVATSAKRDRLALILDKLQITRFFPVQISADDVERLKPEPDPYLEAARHLDVDITHCFVLEDTAAGVRAGHTAGAIVIAVPNKYTRRMDFGEANLVVDSLESVNYDFLAAQAQAAL